MSSSKASADILLVEDDPNFGSVLRDFLQLNGYKVSWADDGANGLSQAQLKTYDLFILDVMMPNVDGFTLAKELVKIYPGSPIIFLTSKSLKDDVIEGFKLGAVDYITKPFDSEVLLYRIKAALKKGPDKKSTEILEIGIFNFDPRSRTISGKGLLEKLSPKEAALLEILCLNKNEVVDREIVLKRIWTDDNYFTARSMDVYITKLRKYLKDDPSIRIENIHGKGFKLHTA